MATQELSYPDRFPPGTTVSVYLRSDQPGADPLPDANPAGSVVTTGVADNDGIVVLNGLIDNTRYVAYALVNGTRRFVSFVAEPSSAALAKSTADAAYDPQYPPGVCAPQGNAETVGSTAPGANTMMGCRVIVPRTGTLHDLYVIIGVSSGNVRGAVYDVGATTNAVRTRLWDGASTPSAGGWLLLGDPNLPVTAGTHLDFAVMGDNVTVSFGRRNTSGRGDLPGVLGMVGGCNFEIGWQFPPGSFANPATLTEANTNSSVAAIPVIVGRIT